MKKIIQRHAKLLLICGSAIIFSGSALAGKTHLTMGMVLEPPHLDPTAGAAAAIDEVVYANVFEGLTRINQNAEVLPALRELQRPGRGPGPGGATEKLVAGALRCAPRGFEGGA